MGKFHVTGKNDKGELMDSAGIWTAAYVKQDGGWKIRMLTAAPKPPEQRPQPNRLSLRRQPVSRKVGVVVVGSTAWLPGLRLPQHRTAKATFSPRRWHESCATGAAQVLAYMAGAGISSLSLSHMRTVVETGASTRRLPWPRLPIWADGHA